MERAVVIGVDGGGTYTRALCCGLDGRVLGYAETGGASPQHNAPEMALGNVQEAVRRAVAEAGRTLADVAALAAGLAGLDRPADQAWAERFTALPGLDCPRLQVNDSYVAHAGALRSRPGIVIIAGTGSILLGINELGEARCNYDYQHYANTSARALAFAALHRLLLGQVAPDDAAFERAVLDYWRVPDRAGLRAMLLSYREALWADTVQAFGQMATLVTGYAAEGAPLPAAVCAAAAEELRVGIALLGTGFSARPISVALIGGAARSAALRRALQVCLEREEPGRYDLVEPALSPVAGAVLLAMRQCGHAADETALVRLAADPRATVV